jgi:mRNA interferase MazF
MKRGDVVVVADQSGGDYAGKPRPAVVIQSDLFDGTESIVVCPLTTRPRDAGLLRVAVMPAEALRLAVPSWVMVDKLTTIRRDRARTSIGHLAREEMLALERSLAVFLGLG